MKVSLEWLNQYVDTSGLAPEEIAGALTNAGLEVESIDTVGPVFSNVVVGKVQKVEPHPNADRLRLVTVDLGHRQNQVVCGAPNVAEGMRIAYAQLGAKVINRKEGGLFELTPAKIRGVESSGMVCSIEELGLQDRFGPNADGGIWPLNDIVTDADLGKDLKEALQLEGGTVFDMTPNANRGDQMSVIGVAREVAALFDRPLTLPQPKSETAHPAGQIQVKLADPRVCEFYIGGELTGIQIGPSPDWMVRRLEASGIRPINNVVDITNYVMLEYGQPLHAFDQDKLGQGTIGVRRAEPGEKFTTLDEVEHTLTQDSVLITFNGQPVALAGVMGGLDSEIADTTQRVFLEAAFFPSASNRRNARSVGMRTDSSARFERGVDPLSVETAFSRAIGLLQELAGGRLVHVSQDDHRQKQTPQVALSIKRVERILGLAIPREEITRTLSILGFTVAAGADDDTLQVTVPSFRATDVYREIDLIEEIIRIHGYDNIPYTLPGEASAPTKTPRARNLALIRNILTGAGLSEVTTYSLIGETLLRQTGFTHDTATEVRITNSHSRDHTIMRQSLIPSLLEIARENQDQGNHNLWVFELGRTYFRRSEPQEKASGVEEDLMLGGLIMNRPARGVWHQDQETDYFTVKGIVESLFEQLNLQKPPRWMVENVLTTMHPGQTARIKLAKRDLGYVGQLHPALRETLKFKSPVYVFELNLEVLLDELAKQPPVIAVESLSAYPQVTRDIAFQAPETVSHQQILSALNQANVTLVRDVELFDEYKGEQIQSGHRSLAYRLTLQSDDHTLTESEIDSTVARLKDHLKDSLAVNFR